MRLNIQKKLMLFAVLASVLTSCTAKIDKETVTIPEKAGFNRESEVNVTQPEQSKNQDSRQKIEDSQPKVVVDDKNTKPSKTDDTQKPAANQDNKQDADGFKGYDNKRYGWGYKKQKNAPPIISKSIDDLLKKYDGMYVQHTDEKVLYLTFDEGYENGYTPKILDVLKENQVPAAFFITGPYLKKHSDLIKRMVEEGHIVGNHTVNHPSMPEIPDDKKLEEELLGLERSFYEMFKTHMKYVRPPKGEFSERTLALTKSLGYKTVFWSFAYVDWDVKNQKGVDYAYDQVMSGLHNGAILLLHAVSKDNAEALDRIIKDARALGYKFKSLDEIQ
ncbi:MAG: peptidoglycan-N-acetylmuramic acid deacetylase [Petroclostridium sp.]|jgi:peptidoglycan-N-acetylmuramic acid deacetylase|nr:peptidoglycan-N-acetylmuramic acid deacetylase [Petroclostridium sp.]